jgi:prolyl-tRNA synthetase
LESGKVKIYYRHDGEKELINLEPKHIAAHVVKKLDEIQHKMLERSRKALKEATVPCNTIDDMQRIVEDKKIAFAPFCNSKNCEESIKEKTGAKSLNTPRELKDEEYRCINCGKPAKLFYFGKSY